MTNPEIIDKGRAITESGKYRPTPNDLPRLFASGRARPPTVAGPFHCPPRKNVRHAESENGTRNADRTPSRCRRCCPT